MYHRRIPPESGFEILNVPVSNLYSKYNHLTFSYEVLWNSCHYAISVYMLCCTKWNQVNCPWNLDSTFLLLFYLCLDQRNNHIPCKTKLKHKEVLHPLPSDLNTTCEYRFWSQMAFAFIYKVATCLLVMFYSFNVMDSDVHIVMTFIYNRTYSESFN